MKTQELMATAMTIMLLLPLASAVSIGAGPSTLDFGKMVRGGYAEQTVTVGTSENVDLTCKVEYTGDTKDWITIDKGNTFTLPANGRIELKAIIQPKPEIANGKYEGAIYIKAAPTSSVTSGAGLAVGAGVKIRLNVEITGKEDLSLTVNSVIVEDTETGYPIKVKTQILNTGNIQVKPKITADILDSYGTKLISGEYADTQILPTREETILFTIPSKGMASGKYNAAINVHAQDQLIHSKVVPFNILPPGTLSVKGTLKDLTLNTETPTLGEVIKITATFQNTGQVPLTVKLKTESSLNDKLQDVKESDSVEVDPESTVELETYYTPTKPGNHVIKAQAIYNSVKSESKTVIATVEDENSVSPDVFVAAAAVIILLIMIYLKTRKKQLQYQHYVQQAPPIQAPPTAPQSQIPQSQQPNPPTTENTGQTTQPKQ